MKTINQKIIYKLIFLGLFFVVSSCETIELELLDDPDEVSLTQADLDFFLNSNEVALADIFQGRVGRDSRDGVSGAGMETTRMKHMTGPTYQNAFTSDKFNIVWEYTYSRIISNNRALEPLANEQGAFQHLGIAQLIEAYVVTTVVDYIGDIPYSEAVAGVSNPSRDSGTEIYAAMLTLIDSAIENLNKTSLVSYSSDIYYGGDSEKWIKFANTLKLKLYLQSRLVNSAESTTGINAIIASGNYITAADDDFQFNWTTTDNNPDSRHPDFAKNFDSPGIVIDYMSNHFMNELNAGPGSDKTVVDPRLRYYFYRQIDRNAVDTNEQDCFGSLPPSHYGFTIPFCTTSFPGYWGRDHGDDAGIPPDTGFRATWGVYPVGGVFDNDSFEPIVSRSVGYQGAGISPIMLSSYVNFMLAESALTLGTTGDAATYLREGVTQSISKVMEFGSGQAAGSPFEPEQADIDAYIDEVMATYAAGDNDEKLNTIMTEYHIALWGNGVEAYNSYRRTGMPNDLQPIRAGDVDNFLRSFFYPTSSVSNNSNSDQKDNVTVQVFWDTNPATGFIN